MELSPLWPPSPPLRLILRAPNGRLKSSQTTSRSSGASIAPQHIDRADAAQVDVRGRVVRQYRSLEGSRAKTNSPRPGSRRRSILSIRPATVFLPILCLVPEYRSPGLPSPSTAAKSGYSDEEGACLRFLLVPFSLLAFPPLPSAHSSPSCEHGLFRRRLLFDDGGSDDRDHGRIRLVDYLAGREGEVPDLKRITDVKIGDVDRKALGDVPREGIGLQCPCEAARALRPCF